MYIRPLMCHLAGLLEPQLVAWVAPASSWGVTVSWVALCSALCCVPAVSILLCSILAPLCRSCQTGGRELGCTCLLGVTVQVWVVLSAGDLRLDIAAAVPYQAIALRVATQSRTILLAVLLRASAPVTRYCQRSTCHCWFQLCVRPGVFCLCWCL